MSNKTKTNGEPRSKEFNSKRIMGQRKYVPKIPLEQAKLPSIDEFELDHILSKHLKKESDMLVDALLNTAGKYQLDLKGEIRRRLSAEQRIQSFNIFIAKMIRDIDNQLGSRTRKLNRVLKQETSLLSNGNSGHNVSFLQTTSSESAVDNEVNKLVELSEEVTSNISSLSLRLNALKGHLESKENATFDMRLYPYLSKMIENCRKSSPTSMPTEVGKFEGINNSKAVLLNESKHIVNKDGNRETHKDEDEEAYIPSNMEELTEEEFEKFMSHAIQRYRSKLQKLGESSVYNDTVLTSTNLENTKIKRPSGLPKLSPLDLLRPESPAYSSYKNKNIIDNVPLKSAAAPELTLQTSHYKKLRINGEPITAESIRELNDVQHCQCQNSSTIHIDKKEVNGNNTSTGHGADSHAERTSMQIDSPDRIERTNYGGLLSSESSDWDSLSANSDANDSMTDRYYSRFKESLKESIRRRDESRKTLISEDEAESPELSPTPKHQPSHHILKPKRSILKLPSSSSNRFQYFELRGKAPPSPIETRLGTSPFDRYINQTQKETFGTISNLNVNGTFIRNITPDSIRAGTQVHDDEEQNAEGTSSTDELIKGATVSILKEILETD